MSWLTLVRAALAAPARLRKDPSAATSARLLLVGALGAALFGAVAGSLDASTEAIDVQALYAAIKMPFVLLLPLVVTLPTLHRLRAPAAPDASWADTTREGALAVARIGLTLLAAAPVVWIAWSAGLDHARAVQVLAAVVAGAFAIGLRGLFLVEGARTTRWLAVGLLAVTLGQTSWMLRPFVGEPGAERVFVEDGRGLFLIGIVDPMYLRRWAEAKRARDLESSMLKVTPVRDCWESRGIGDCG